MTALLLTIALLTLLAGEAILALRWYPPLYRYGIVLYRRSWRFSGAPEEILRSMQGAFGGQQGLVSRVEPSEGQLLVRPAMGLRWQVSTRASLEVSGDGTAVLKVRLAWWVLGVALVLLSAPLVSAVHAANRSTATLLTSFKGLDPNLFLVPLVVLLMAAFVGSEILRYRRCARVLTRSVERGAG